MAKGQKTGGRVAGVPNVTTRAAKTAIENAFAHLQGQPGKDFNTWAEANTDDFYKLLFPKLLPVQLNHGGDTGGPLQIIIRRQGDA